MSLYASLLDRTASSDSSSSSSSSLLVLTSEAFKAFFFFFLITGLMYATRVYVSLMVDTVNVALDFLDPSTKLFLVFLIALIVD